MKPGKTVFCGVILQSCQAVFYPKRFWRRRKDVGWFCTACGAKVVKGDHLTLTAKPKVYNDAEFWQ